MNNKKGAIPYETAPLTHIKDTAEQAVKQLETAMQVLINWLLTLGAFLVVIMGAAL